MFGTVNGFSNFFKSVHLKSRILYTDHICKIVNQEQELFNFDRFIITQPRSRYKYSFFAQEGQDNVRKY